MTRNSVLARSRGVVWATLLAATILGVTGCTSSGTDKEADDSGSAPTADVRAAEEHLAEYTDVTAPAPLGEPFDVSDAAGQTIGVVDYAGANPAIAEVSASTRSALEHVGLTVRRCDAQGASTQVSSCMDQVRAQGAQAVVVVGGDLTAFTSGIDSAHAADVPVVSALDLVLPSEVEESGVDSSDAQAQADLVDAIATVPAALSGTLIADAITADSGGGANILFIHSPGIFQAEYEMRAFQTRIEEICPDCNVITDEVALPSWPSDIAPLVQAKLAQNPDLDYVVPALDPMTAYTNPAINQAGKSDQIKVATANGNIQQLSELAQGSVLFADVGQNLAEVGLIAADQALRLLVGAPEVEAAAGAARIFTSDNIDSIDVKSEEDFHDGAWFTGDPDALTDAYYGLWTN